MSEDNVKIITRNRKARHEYHIEETLEAGMVLTGTEIKSIRAGQASIQEAFIQERSGEMWVVGMHISQYDPAHQDNHDPVRTRKLLMHRRQIEDWAADAQQKGYTIIPLELYLRNGRAKLLIGLAKGKKLYDKRQVIAERDAERRMRRAAGRHERGY